MCERLQDDRKVRKKKKNTLKYKCIKLFRPKSSFRGIIEFENLLRAWNNEDINHSNDEQCLRTMLTRYQIKKKKEKRREKKEQKSYLVIVNIMEFLGKLIELKIEGESLSFEAINFQFFFSKIIFNNRRSNDATISKRISTNFI